MPSSSRYDLFISYSQSDGEIVASLAAMLHDAGIAFFQADKGVSPGALWESQIKEALISSHRMMVLLTPRSLSSPWVATEVGAGWILEKEFIPVLMQVAPTDIFAPLHKFQAHRLETPKHFETLIKYLSSLSETRNPPAPEPHPVAREKAEHFNDQTAWDNLVKIGHWQYEPTTQAITGEGMYRYLLSEHEYGSESFIIDADIEFSELRSEGRTNTVNAGIVLGWSVSGGISRYLHLMFTGSRLLLEAVGYSGGDECYDFSHLDEGVPFNLEKRISHSVRVVAERGQLVVTVGGKFVYSANYPGNLITGKVGLRPWRSTLVCKRFEVTPLGK